MKTTRKESGAFQVPTWQTVFQKIVNYCTVRSHFKKLNNEESQMRKPSISKDYLFLNFINKCSYLFSTLYTNEHEEV